jgi:hypothetical protein
MSALCRQATRDRDAAKAIARAKRPVICDGPSLGRKRCESFAASKAYDVSTRQVVAIHTQYRDKVAGPIGWPAKIKLRRGHSPARIICETARKAGLRLFQPLQAALDQPCCDSSDLVSLFLRALKEPIGSTTPK